MNSFRVSCLAGLLLLGLPAYGHEGHDAAPGQSSGPLTGPITVTAEAAKNLGLKVEAAELRTLQKTLSILGTVELDPTRVAAVASRISGRVTRLAVKEGDVVNQADFLVEIESRQIGDPPPKVELKSPIKGTVIERPIFTGDSVEPEARLMMVADLSEVYLVGRVFEGQVSEIKKGQAVRVRPEAYRDDSFTGTVEGFTPRVDPETRTLGVRVKVANPDGKLLPNMLVTMNVVTAEADSAITVPLSAVLGEAGQLFVFVQDGKDPQVFERTPVVTGQRDDRYVEIIEGVLPGASVVTAGNYQLQYVTPAVRPPASEAKSESATTAAPAEKK